MNEWSDEWKRGASATPPPLSLSLSLSLSLFFSLVFYHSGYNIVELKYRKNNYQGDLIRFVVEFY